MKACTAFFVATFLAAGTSAVQACPSCRPAVTAAVYNQEFTGNLVALLLPVVLLTAIGVAVYFSGRRTHTSEDAHGK